MLSAILNHWVYAASFTNVHTLLQRHVVNTKFEQRDVKENWDTVIVIVDCYWYGPPNCNLFRLQSKVNEHHSSGFFFFFRKV